MWNKQAHKTQRKKKMQVTKYLKTAFKVPNKK